MKKLLVTILVTIVCIQLSHATCVILVVGKNGKITVGADSKAVILGAPPKDSSKIQTSISTYCKIQTEGNLNFAVVGLFSDETHSALHNYCKQFNNINSLLSSRIDTNLLDMYNDYINHMSPANYNRLQKMLGDVGAPLQVIFFGQNEEGVAYTLILEYKFVNNKYGDISISNKVFAGQDIIYLGDAPELEDIGKDSIKKMVSKIGDVETIKYLMGIVIKNHPKTVGYPIDIMQIDKNGRRWIQHKNNCP